VCLITEALHFAGTAQDSAQSTEIHKCIGVPPHHKMQVGAQQPVVVNEAPLPTTALDPEYVKPSSLLFDNDISYSGQVSSALKNLLIREDLADIDVLLRYKALRTVRVMAALNDNDLAVLIGKTNTLFNTLDSFRNAEQSVKRLVSHCKGYGTKRMPTTGPALPGLMNSSGTSSSSSDYVAPVSPLQVERPDISFPVARDDDCMVRKQLMPALEDAREILGNARVSECIRRIVRSDALAAASAHEAAEAVAALNIPPAEIKERLKLDRYKVGKLYVRCILNMRIVSHAMGMDQKEAVQRYATEAVRNTAHDANAVSQVQNGVNRWKDEITNQVLLDRKIAAEAKAAQEAGAARRASSRPAAPGRHSRNDKHVQKLESSPQTTANHVQQYSCETHSSGNRLPATQIMQQSDIASASRPGSLAPPHRSDPQKDFDSSIACSQLHFPDTLQSRSCSLPPRQSVCPSIAKTPLEKITMAVAKNDISSLTLPPANGQLAKSFVNNALSVLKTSSDAEDIADSAAWLAHTHSSLDEQLAKSVQHSLELAVLREDLQEKNQQQHIMKCLACVAGENCLLLTMFDNAFKDTVPSPLLAMLAKTWAWMLVHGRDGNGLQLNTDTDEHHLSQLMKRTMCFLDITMDSLVTLNYQDIAKDSCSALRVLVEVAKVSQQLTTQVATWLFQVTVKFSSYHAVVHEGVRGLLAVCKTHRELFSLNLSTVADAKREPSDTQKHHREIVMGFACTMFGKRKEFGDEIVQGIVRLLVHTHPWVEALRFVCQNTKNSEHCGQLVMIALDEAHLSLSSDIAACIEAGVSGSALALAGSLKQNSILAAVQHNCHACIGVRGLEVLNETSARDKSSSLDFIMDWASKAPSKDQQSRVLLVSFVFGVEAIVPSLRTPDTSSELFLAVCAAIVQVNRMAPLHATLKQEIASTMLTNLAPEEPQSCAAWVNVIGMMFHNSSDTGLPQLTNLAEEVVINHVRQVFGRKEWSAFTFEAIAALNHICNCQSTGQLSDPPASGFRQLAFMVQAATQILGDKILDKSL
jgi:hypothetical protein